MADKELPSGVAPSQPQITGYHTATLDSSQEWEGWQGWFSRLCSRLINDPAIAYAVSIFLTHRLLLSALGAVLAFFAPIEPPLGSALLRDVNPYFGGPSFFLLAPWQRWDTNWYIRIAQLGYDVGNGTTNFPPLYPFLVGVSGRLLVGQYMLAAMIISNLAYVAALTYLYKLTVKKFDESTARRTLLFLAAFPSAFFLAAAYTESLYLLLAVAAFYYAEDKRWYLAAGLAALAGITRIQGVLLVIPLGYLYLEQRKFKWRKLFSPANFKLFNRDGLALAVSPVLFGLYMLWVFVGVGDHNFGNHLLVIWHIKFAMPWETFFVGLAGFFDPVHTRNMIFNILDLAALTLFISLTIVWWQKKLPFHYFLYATLSMLLYLTRQGTEDFFWMSMNRYVLTVFPGFMLLGKYASPRLLKPAIFLQAVWAVFFIFWMWAG